MSQRNYQIVVSNLTEDEAQQVANILDGWDMFAPSTGPTTSGKVRALGMNAAATFTVQPVAENVDAA